jgi:hypothetical protein
MSINDKKVVEKPKTNVKYLWTESIRSWLNSQNKKSLKKKALLNDESWKDTQVSNKQAKASPTPSTKKKKKKRKSLRNL